MTRFHTSNREPSRGSQATDTTVARQREGLRFLAGLPKNAHVSREVMQWGVTRDLADKTWRVVLQGLVSRLIRMGLLTPLPKLKGIYVMPDPEAVKALVPHWERATGHQAVQLRRNPGPRVDRGELSRLVRAMVLEGLAEFGLTPEQAKRVADRMPPPSDQQLDMTLARVQAGTVEG